MESLAGDIMLLGNTSWRIKGVEMGKVRVEDAHGAPPNIPFWRGRGSVAHGGTFSGSGKSSADDRRTGGASSLPAVQWLKQDCGLDQRGAQQAVEYVLMGKAVLGVVPTQQTRSWPNGSSMKVVGCSW